MVTPVMTKAAQQFVTPLAVGALSGGKVFADLFDRKDEHESATSACRARPTSSSWRRRPPISSPAARGHADDLATAVLLAADKPVLVAPAMNLLMWAHPATARNVAPR